MVSADGWYERDKGKQLQIYEKGDIPEHSIGHLDEVETNCKWHGEEGLDARFIAGLLSRDEEGKKLAVHITSGYELRSSHAPAVLDLHSPGGIP